MVSTRRQQKQQQEKAVASQSQQQAKPEEKEDEELEDDVEQNDSTADEEKGKDTHLSSGSSDKKQKASSRKVRKQQRETLRSKNLGLIRIAAAEGEAADQPSTKIVFKESDNKEEGSDDEEEISNFKKGTFSNDDNDQGEEDDDDAPEQAVTTATNDAMAEEEEEEDDDDAVEQVDSSVARNIALAERQRERTTRNAQATKTKRKRKHRPNDTATNQDDDLEDDFFAELEAQKAANRKAKKAKPEQAIPKHTIFQSADEPYTTPMEVNPGMELVVLRGHDTDGNDMSLALMAAAEPSETALFHSRRHILDGSDIISAKQAQKQRKLGLAPPEANWKRSKKMNRLLFGQRGRPAPNFAVNKAVKTYKF